MMKAAIVANKRARLAVATIPPVIVLLFWWWKDVDKSLDFVLALLLGFSVVFTGAALMVAYLHFRRIADLDEESRDRILLPYYVVLGIVILVFCLDLFKALRLRSFIQAADVAFWIRVDVILAVYRLLEVAEGRLQRKGTDLWSRWRKSGRQRQVSRVGLVVVVVTFVVGVAFVHSGYEYLNAAPSYFGYPYVQPAKPLYDNYSVPVTNMTIQINITHTTYVETFVVGEPIYTNVVLTSLYASPNTTKPYLKGIAFPPSDEWGFRYYRSYSGSDYDSGNQLTAQANRFFPEPGQYRVLQNWTVSTGSSRNESISVFLNLTVYERAAIESFEKQRDRLIEVYLQYLVLQQQTGYNFILIGVSLIFGAALIPALVDLILKAFPEQRNRRSYKSRVRRERSPRR